MIKRDELSNHKKTQNNIKCILLSEKSLSERLHSIESQVYFEKGKNIAGKKSVVARDLEAERNG